MRLKAPPAILATATVAAVSLPAAGQSVRWIAPAGGSFGTAAHWESGAVPNTATRAIFDLADSYAVTLDSSRSVGGFTMSNGALTFDLHSRMLTLPADLVVTSGSIRLQSGYLNHIVSVPTIRSSILVNGGVLSVDSDAHISIANSLVISTGATMILHGTVPKCTPALVCNSYKLISRPGSSLRVEGGITSGGSVTLHGNTEVIGGYLGGLYCIIHGDLVVDGGQVVASEQWVDLLGTTIVRNGGRIDGGSTGISSQKLVNVRGGTLMVEGSGSSVGATFAIEDNATVTVRNGALIGNLAGSGESRCSSGSLIIEDGGTCAGRFSLDNTARMRIEPGGTGPREYFFLGRPSTTIEIGLDPLRAPVFQPMESPSFHAAVSGHLRIEFHNSNAFNVGSEVTLFTTTGTFTGSFESITVPPLDGGRIAQVTVAPQSIKLRIVQGPPSCYSTDFNGDGDSATDADIAAFFACLAGDCCPTCASSDFNGDADYGTDADIEAFFRVLAGNNC